MRQVTVLAITQAFTSRPSSQPKKGSPQQVVIPRQRQPGYITYPQGTPGVRLVQRTTAEEEAGGGGKNRAPGGWNLEPTDGSGTRAYKLSDE